METISNDELLAAFTGRTLPKERWDHEAHIRVCHAALARFGRDEALGFLRDAIRAYNEVVGPPNTDSTGYHETLTRYFVLAVASMGDADIDTILRTPACSREASLASA